MTVVARLMIVGLLAALLAGLLGGLSRLLFLAPVADVLKLYHGPILCALVFPGLIGLERAVAIGARWAWLAPILALLGLAVAFSQSLMVPEILMSVALLLLAQQLFLWRRSPGIDGEVGSLAALLLIVSNWTWIRGGDYFASAYGWASFLILLIAAERLELSFAARSRAIPARAFSLLLATGVVLSSIRLIGLGWLALALWLAHYDLARRNARRTGLPAFSARAVMLGYGWLAVSGFQLVFWGLSGANFDRILHGVFVGFVLSMVMAHGPIIFPALLRFPMRFSNWLYLPLIALHVSLAVRVLGPLVSGAMGNLLAVLLFALTAALHLGGSRRPWLAEKPPPSSA